MVSRPRRPGRAGRPPLSITPDAWLAERFGRPVFTVGPGTSGADVRAHANGPAFYQARVPAADVVRVTDLACAGMRVVNTGLTLGRDGGAVDAPGDVEVRVGEPGRDDAACDIAERAFTFDRFHLDPEVPDAVADRIKRDWVANTLSGARGEHLLVAVRQGRVAGFLGVLRRGDVSVIDLAAVDPGTQGQGVGRALAARFLADCLRAEVGTQAANPRATRFYERLGFTALRASYDLHLTTA